MTTPRNVVNMPAVATKQVTPAPSSRKRVRDAAVLSMLVVTVTGAGVAVGALGISPLLGADPMRAIRRGGDVAIGFLFEMLGELINRPQLAAAAAFIIVMAMIVAFAARTRRARGTRGSSTKSPAAFTARTPRDVQVLAAAGQAPVEIAARTRLSVDAVSMLLNIGQAQQAQGNA